MKKFSIRYPSAGYTFGIIITVSLILLLGGASILYAQEGDVSQPIVKKSLFNDTSIPLRDMVEAPISKTSWEDGVIPLRNATPKYESKYEKDYSLQLSTGTGGDATIIENFDGVATGTGGFFVLPPDPSMDVGPNHVMQMVNLAYQIWDKNGNSLLGPFTLGTLWSGFPGPWASSLNDGDPVVLYDQAADRWFASQFSIPNNGAGPEYILIAISQTSDPTGSWHRYGFEFPQFPDYPKYGIWPDGYYMSVNRFAPSYTGTYNVAFERDMMLNGAAAQYVVFPVSSATTYSLLPSDWDGANPPPAGAPNYFVMAHDNAFFGGADGLDIFEFHVDWTTPGNSTFTGPVAITTSPFSMVSGIPQAGTGQLLDDLSDRLMHRLQYRNFGSHQSMVVNQTIDAGSGRAGVRWYELQNTSSGWSLFQEGTYAPADGLERWMGSIAMNGNGDIALGYTVSSANINPDIRFTGRLNGDPLGTMTVTETTIHSSSGAQTHSAGRWGDYSQMSVDPVDDNTFWYTHEYIASTGSANWNTRIASLQLDGTGCPAVDVVIPDLVETGLTTGDPVSVMLTASDFAGCDVISFQFTITYDPAVVTATGINTTGTISDASGWTVLPNTGTAGVFQVAGFGATPLVGSGDFIELLFDVANPPPSNTDLTSTEFLFNAGTPTANVTDGSITLIDDGVCPAVDVVIPDVVETGLTTGDPVSVMLTASDFAGCDVISFQFTITYDPAVVTATGINTTGTISDASGWTVLPNTGTAGVFQVAGFGAAPLVGSGDFIELLFDVANPPPGYTDLISTEFLFNAGSPTANVTDGSITLIDDGVCPAVDVVIPDVVETGLTTGEPVSVMLNASDFAGCDVISFQFTITYDPAVVTATGINTTGTISDASGWTVLPNTGTAGVFQVAGFGATPLVGSGDFIELLFDVANPPPGYTDLISTEFLFNAGSPTANVTDGSITLEPDDVCPVVDVVIPDLVETGLTTGDPVSVMLTASDFAGCDVISFQFTITYDSAVVTATGINTTGTISDATGWTVLPNTGTAGVFQVAGFGATPLVGSGDFIELLFDVANPPPGYTDLISTEFLFNAGSPTANVTDGSITLEPDDVCPVVDVVIPDVVETGLTTGDPVSVMLTASDFAGCDVISFQFTITYDSAVVTATGINTTGTISDATGWTVLPNTGTAGVFQVAGFGATPLVGSGDFIELLFDMANPPPGYTDLISTEFLFNAGSPTANVTDGSITLNPVVDGIPLDPVAPLEAFPGDIITVDIDLGSVSDPVADLQVISFDLLYTSTPPPIIINYANNYAIGGFWGSNTPTVVVIPDDPNGTISASMFILGGSQSGHGTIISFDFQVSNAATEGQTIDWSFGAVAANNSSGDPISIQPGTATTTIRLGLKVWPGDTDNNGTVQIIDINPIITRFGNTGPARDPADQNCAWVEYIVPPWTPESDTYVDANGNGQIDITDINCVIVNHGNTHPLMTKPEVAPANFTADPPLTGTSPSYMEPGEEYWVEITVGDATLPVTDMQVISFDVLYDNTQYIDYLSFEVGSFMSGATPVVLADDPSGKVSVSLFKLSPPYYTGDGVAIRLKFMVNPTTPPSPEILISNSWGEVQANRSDGSEQPLAPQPFTYYISPVELISFNSNIEKNNVTLSWETASETNNSGFEVERMIAKDWEKIAFVEGRGTTTEKQYYQYIDDFRYTSVKGILNYRLKQIDFNGTYEYSKIIEVDVDFTPNEYVLYQNYPNPFNPSTTIKYAIPKASNVNLSIYNVVGEVVSVLVNKVQEGGFHEIDLDVSELPSGIYYYRITADSFVETKKMILMK